MTANADTKSISMEFDLPHAPEKVWRALTEPKLLASWLMANDLRPVVGNSFTFNSDPTPWWDGIVHCEVLELARHKRLSYSWRSGPESSPLDTVVTAKRVKRISRAPGQVEGWRGSQRPA